MAEPTIDERYEVGDILEDSKTPGTFIIITEVHDGGYTFRFYDKEKKEPKSRPIQTETLNDKRTFTYFKKI